MNEDAVLSALARLKADLVAQMERIENKLSAIRADIARNERAASQEHFLDLCARLGGIEGRIVDLAAGQASHERAIMRIAEVQAEHTMRLTRIERRLDGIEGLLTDHTAQITRMEGLLIKIARKLDGAAR